ncbi:sigma-54 interaction domain-containing protein [Laribacter hongkongensis]|uniref:sigma-54 interaction domain-containing protein n=1 Tax=Laribacter hongkongensis TaxID=168471 RepID=UPI001EFC60D6|nr:sigma-54-dependent Fis family transcriptional regulator [Laribacter hongkongensis]MCG9096504.1 sigma-54-dependent Fis family transcriptional regulator [Laribacter hongkongensis]
MSSSLNVLSRYLDALAAPHILCDRDYRIRFANRAYRERFAHGAEIVGQPCFAVSHHYRQPCNDCGESCPLQRSLQSRQMERGVHLHHSAQGEEFVEIELTPVFGDDGQCEFFIERMQPLPLAAARNEGLVGRSPAFQTLLDRIARVAPSHATVLVQGESGSGKELVAHAIHRGSARAGRPFVTVDCTGLPENLIESELFGHERGAFTGAVRRQQGLVEAADGGTLFLDEIGDMPLAMQARLLRFLETGTYRHIGSPELRRADVRVISATHRNLRERVAAGAFRADLYYRLACVPLSVPPLRERREDLVLLAEALLARQAGQGDKHLSAGALDRLAGYDFPGNVRELRNILERASLFASGSVIGRSHVDEALDGWEPAEPAGPAAPAPDELARQVREFSGTRRQLAQQLGISERTLYRLLRTARVAGQETDT